MSGDQPESTPPGTPAIARFRRLLGSLLLVYWVALFVSTHVPLPKQVHMPGQSDKWIHVAAYAVLACLLGLWISATRRLGRRETTIVFVAAAGYAIFDELSQLPVEGRHADLYDVFADWLGAVGGVAASLIWARWASAASWTADSPRKSF